MAVKMLSEKYGYTKKQISQFLDYFFGSYMKMGVKELCRRQEITTIKGLGRFYPTPKGTAAKKRRAKIHSMIDTRCNQKYHQKRKEKE